MPSEPLSDDVLSELSWLIENSEAVTGLRLDGRAFAWSEVLASYMPRTKEALAAMWRNESRDAAAPGRSVEGRDA